VLSFLLVFKNLIQLPVLLYLYCPWKRGQYMLFSTSLLFFFSVSSITHEPLHLAWWNFAWTCILTTSTSLLNFKVIGQRSRSHGFFVCFCLHDTRWQYLALSEGFTCCCLSTDFLVLLPVLSVLWPTVWHYALVNHNTSSHLFMLMLLNELLCDNIRIFLEMQSSN